MAKGRGKRGVLIAIAAALAVVVGLCVWWLLRDDGPLKQPNPPVVQTPNPPDPATEQAPVARRDAASPSIDSGAGPEADGETATSTAKEAAAPEMVPTLLTIDGEEVPAEAITIRNHEREGPRTEYKITIAGRVLELDGGPVAGATVWVTDFILYPHPHTKALDRATYVTRAPIRDSMVHGSPIASTDEHGRYEIAVEASYPTPDEGKTAFSSLMVQARAEEFAPTVSRNIYWNSRETKRERVDGVDLLVGKQTRVRGHVVWSDSGEPAPGASVAMTRVFTADRRRPPSATASVETPALSVPRQLASDDGGFEFVGVVDGDYLCWAVWPETTHAQWRYRNKGAPEPPLHSVKLQIRGGKAVEDVRILIHRVARLTFRTAPPLEVAPGVAVNDTTSVRNGIGRSIDTTGRGTSGGGSPAPMEEWTPTRLVDGSWAVSGIMPDHKMLWVFAPGYLPSSANLDVIAGRDFDAGTIVLDLGAMIEGKVTDKSGRPLAGAVVRARSARAFTALGAGSSNATTYTSSTNGPDGSYRLSGLSLRSYEVVASLDGYHDEMKIAQAKADIPTRQDFVLASADALVHGRIEWGPDGPPRHAPSAVVYAVSTESALADRISKDAPLPVVSASEDVWVELRVEMDWTFRGTLKAGGYKFVFAQGSEFGIVEATAAAGQETEVVFTMGAAAGMTGLVTGIDGLPLVGAEVVAYGPKQRGSQLSLDFAHTAKASVKTDATGRYEIQHVPPGEYLLWLPDYPQYQPHPWQPRGSPNSIVITSGKTGTLDITLRASKEGASVFLELTLDGEPVRLSHSILALFKGNKSPRHAGFFALPDHRMLANDVPYGTHVVSLTISGLSITSTALGEIIEFTVPHGVTEITVARAFTTVEMSARLNLPEGVVPSGVDIALMVGRLHGIEGDAVPPSGVGHVPRADGSVRPFRVTPGRYRLEVKAKNRMTRVIEVDVFRDTHVDVDLGEETGTLVIEFGGLEGPHDAALLAKFRADHSMLGFNAVDAEGNRAFTGSMSRDIRALFSSGNARIEGLTPGRITIGITHGMAEPYSAEVDIVSGCETVLRATFRIAPHITVTIPASDAPADEGPEGVTVIIRPADSDSRTATFRLTKQPDGSYRGESYVRGVGDMVIRTTAGDITDETARVHLPRDGRIEHTIRIKAKE